MRRFVWPVVSIILAVNLRGQIPDSWSILGAKPDVVLVVLIAYSLAADLSFCATLGFIAGLVQGCDAGLALGSLIVTRTITGFVAGLVTTRVFSDNPIVPVLSAMWLTLVCETLFLLGNPRPDMAMAVRMVAGECIWNGIVMLIVHMIMRSLHSRRRMSLANARI